jgi:hypothetical protein
MTNDTSVADVISREGSGREADSVMAHIRES